MKQNIVSYLSTNGSYSIWDYEHAIGAVLQPLGISFSEAISMQLFGSIYLAVATISIGLGILYLVFACECYKTIRRRASTSWAWKGGLIISFTNLGIIIFMLTIGSLGRVALGQEPFLQFEIISGYLLHFGVASTFLFLLYSPSVKMHLHRQTGH